MTPRLLSLLTAAVLAIGLGVLASSPRQAEAHPLGNFTINALARLDLLGEGSVRMRYVLDMAEIPAFQELRQIDRDDDGLVSDPESQAYLNRKAPELVAGLDLRIEGRAVPLSLTAQTLAFAEGQGGLKTLRVTLDLSAQMTGGWEEGVAANLRDRNYAGRIGWREIVVAAGDGVFLTETSVTQTDESAGLTSYPSNRLQSPPDVREASFRFQAGTAPRLSSGSPTSAASRNPERPQPLDRFARLVLKKDLTPAFIALSLLAAAAWGAAHALGPGHGKTIVASYLVGSQGTAWHAVLLGLTVTVTHTSSVIAVGLITLAARPLVPAEDLYLWLGLASGILVILVAAALFTTRLRNLLRRGTSTRLNAAHRGHRHGDSHGSEHHHHAGEAHNHSHAATAPGWRGLLLLGISGGLLPCPTALIVMLGAIALDRTVYGLVLVLAFGVGLSAVLTGIGLILVYANGFLSRPGSRVRLLQRPVVQRAFLAAPVLGSFVMLVAGLLITGRALSGVL